MSGLPTAGYNGYQYPYLDSYQPGHISAAPSNTSSSNPSSASNSISNASSNQSNPLSSASSSKEPPTKKNQPRLIRTSSLPVNYIKQNFNLLKTPIKLTITQDINKMTENWSEREYECQRRLVNFKFIQKSPTQFNINFEPISPADFSIGAPIISCIYWKEENKYIVTSVDIVLLLEYLIKQNFTVEEKNRIRRNLQGLKPTTITRSHLKFLRFFKLIMSMEDPRPRNIEKDIKVFRWEDLPVALNKIISKYSANDLSIINIEFINNNNFSQPNHSFYSGDIDEENFLPFERIKIMKKKLIQTNSSNSLLKKKNLAKIESLSHLNLNGNSSNNQSLSNSASNSTNSNTNAPIVHKDSINYSYNTSYGVNQFPPTQFPSGEYAQPHIPQPKSQSTSNQPTNASTPQHTTDKNDLISPHDQFPLNSNYQLNFKANFINNDESKIFTNSTFPNQNTSPNNNYNSQLYFPPVQHLPSEQFQNQNQNQNQSQNQNHNQNQNQGPLQPNSQPPPQNPNNQPQQPPPQQNQAPPPPQPPQSNQSYIQHPQYDQPFYPQHPYPLRQPTHNISPHTIPLPHQQITIPSMNHLNNLNNNSPQQQFGFQQNYQFGNNGGNNNNGSIIPQWNGAY